MSSAGRSEPRSAAARIRRCFVDPPAEYRPVPLYWWSGGDLDRDHLLDHLDRLAAFGVGGTIAGYSHLANTDLDHGDPAPFSDAWWELLAWYVDASAERGMTVGLQDYGVIGPVLRRVGARTGDLRSGGLVNDTTVVTGPCSWTTTLPDAVLRSGRVVSIRAWADGDAPGQPPVGVHDGAAVHWQVPAGTWRLSVVSAEGAVIGGVASSFDPLHPTSGAAVIEEFYEEFTTRLGDRLGTTFRYLFQDELDFGFLMPLWNDEVEAEMQARTGQGVDDVVHAFWHDVGPDTARIRTTYRDLVVRLLTERYFRPVHAWHEAHGVQALMDQVSRGDLRGGVAHYADFLETMQWYAGPGNDDPDLTIGHNVAAFKVSSSIANLYGRPFVANEGFHSSGWGVLPRDVVGASTIDFAAGASFLILHGLYSTTAGGWWEWASPDFHFRQPWWLHSEAMWGYFARLSVVMRAGQGVRDVAVLDPSQDLVHHGSPSTAPEEANRLLNDLPLHGVDVDVVPQTLLAGARVEGDELVVGPCRYRVVVLPAVHSLRQATAQVLTRFVRAGGAVLAWQRPPAATESGDLPAELVGGVPVVGGETSDLATAVRAARELDVETGVIGLLAAHRAAEGIDLYLVVNASRQPLATTCSFRVRPGARLERWDAWQGRCTSVAEPTGGQAGDRGDRRSVAVDLTPGDAVLLAFVTDDADGARDLPVDSGGVAGAAGAGASLKVETPWTAQVVPVLDNTWGDYDSDRRDVGVPTWRVEEAASADGPWTPQLVDHGVRFFALGPVAPELAGVVEAALTGLTGLDPAQPVVAGGVSLPWRPYRLSQATGIPWDPMLYDRNTGPHGLKGVPAEFLDPHALDADPPAGWRYYFWSTVDGVTGPTLVRGSGRAEYAVWVDGVAMAPVHHEEPPVSFPPWGLRDMTSTRVEAQVTLDGPAAVLVGVSVAADQPTRVGVAVGGTPPTDLDRSRSLWWRGEHPAASFVPRLVDGVGGSAQAWFRVEMPPGARRVRITARGRVVAAMVGDHVVAVPDAVVDGGVTDLDLPAGLFGRALRFAIDVTGVHEGLADVGLISEALRWSTEPGPVRSTRWVESGLADFSGIVRYRGSMTWADGDRPPRRLRLTGLNASARVHLNGRDAGIVLDETVPLDIAGLVTAGENEIEVEVANTLSNFYAHLPSPFSLKQPAAGGFDEVWLMP